MDLESALLLMNNAENSILQDLPVVNCMTDVTPQFLLLNDAVSTSSDSPPLLILKDVNTSETTPSSKKDEVATTVNLLSSFNYIAPSVTQNHFPAASIRVLDVVDSMTEQEGVLSTISPSEAAESTPKVKSTGRARNRAGAVKGAPRKKVSSGRNNPKRTKKQTATPEGSTEPPPAPSSLSLPVISDNPADKITRTAIVTKTTPSNEPPTLSVPDEENVISVTTSGHSKRRLTQQELREIGLLLEKKKSFRRNDEVKKVICRVVYPDDIDEQPPITTKQSQKVKKKIERPPKKPPAAPSASTAALDKTSSLVSRSSPLVTRSGRVSKRPKDFNRVVKILLNTRNKDNFADYFKKDSLEQVGEPLHHPTAENPGEPSSSTNSNKAQLLKGLDRVRQKKRTYFNCPTCNKNYTTILIWRHINKYPWHVDTETYRQIQAEYSLAQASQKRQHAKLSRSNRLEAANQRKSQLKRVVRYCKKDELIGAAGAKFTSSMSTWQFLLLKMRHGRNASQTFLKELKEISEEAANWSTKLFSKDDKTGKIVNIEDDTLSKILRLEKGVYQLNDGELQKLMTPTPQFAEEPELDRSDSSELLQDMMLLDKSTMDTVDQLVNERLKSLAPGPDDLIAPPPTDVQAPGGSHHSLHHHQHHMNHDDDLMSNLLMTAVGDVVPQSCEDISATADDLLKSLETLGPPTLDFTALSNEYNPVR